MNFDEVTLRAYVDQELSAPERSRVDAALEQSPELQTLVGALKASRLPYQSAFDAQNLPPLAEALSRRLDQMVAVAGAQQQEATPAPAHRAAPRRAMLAAGLGACFLGGYGLRAALPGLGSRTAVAPAWVDAVANYQAMYTRSTVEGGVQTLAQRRAVLEAFERSTNAKLTVPNLSDSGLQFKRAQPLVFNERALLQLAYLPQQGKPAALCVLKALAHEPAVPPTLFTLHGLQVVTWVQSGLAYAFASEMPQAQAMALTQELFQGRTAALTT